MTWSGSRSTNIRRRRSRRPVSVAGDRPCAEFTCFASRPCTDSNAAGAEGDAGRLQSWCADSVPCGRTGIKGGRKVWEPAWRGDARTGFLHRLQHALCGRWRRAGQSGRKAASSAGETRAGVVGRLEAGVARWARPGFLIPTPTPPTRKLIPGACKTGARRRRARENRKWSGG